MSAILNTLHRLWKSLLSSLGLENKQGSLLLLGLDNAGKTTLLHKLRCDDVRSFPPTDRPSQETFAVGNIQFSAWDLGGHEAVRHLWEDYVATGVSAILFVIDAADSERLEEAGYELDALVAGNGMFESSQQQQRHHSHPNGQEQQPQGGGDGLLEGIPIAILLNKCDLPEALSTEEICRRIDYDSLCKMHSSSGNIDSKTNGQNLVQHSQEQSQHSQNGMAETNAENNTSSGNMALFRISVLRGQGYQDAFRWVGTFL